MAFLLQVPLAGRMQAPPVTHPRVWLYPERGGAPVLLPFAPVQLDNDGLTPEYTVISTPGQDPLVVPGGPKPHVVSGSAALVQRDGEPTVEETLHGLRRLARISERVRWSYGPSEQGWWIITDLGWATRRRDANNAITEATVSFELTRASRPDGWKWLPVQAAQAGRAAPPPPLAPTQPLPQRTVSVNAGDTLYRIAAVRLGSGNRWQEIAALNRITDPRRLRVGQVLKLP